MPGLRYIQPSVAMLISMRRQFTGMLCCFSSCPAYSVSFSRATFETEYETIGEITSSARIDEMLMMRPLLRSIIEGKKACMHMTGPRRLTFITRSQRLRGVSWKGAGALIAALLTRMSQRPNSFRVRSAICWMSSSFVTSTGIASARLPRASTSRAVCSIVPGSFEGAFSELRAVTTTCAPAFAKSMTIWRPIPRLAPVTTATWSCRGPA